MPNNPKYIYENFAGDLVYPREIKVIKSKEDLRRWFEWSSQFEQKNDLADLISKIKLPYEHIRSGTKESTVFIMFPRCKFVACAKFFGVECYSISCN